MSMKTLMTKSKSTTGKVLAKPMSGRGLSPMRHPSDGVMEQLKNHKKAVEDRIASAEFAQYILAVEFGEWSRMQKETAVKLASATPATYAAIERLNDIALLSVERYGQRGPQLATIIGQLNNTLDRIKAAISVLEVDQNLRSVSNMFSVDGFEQMNFNMETETEEIRRLCYNADAFLELEA